MPGLSRKCHVGSEAVCEWMSRCRFQRWIEGLLWEGPDSDDHLRSEILRMKGLVAVADDQRRHVLQAVGQTYDIMPGLPWPVGADRTTRIVVIGSDLRPDLLNSGLTSCCG